MSIEILEPRIAPAAILNLTTSGSNLKIKGATPDVPLQFGIVVGASGPGVDIFLDPSTTVLLNGSTVNTTGDLHLSSVTGGISIDGGSASSDIHIFGGRIGGGLNIVLGGSTNTVEIGASRIVGNVQITSAAAGATNILTFDSSQAATIGGSLKLALGNASNVVSVTGQSLEVDGGFAFLGGPTKSSVPAVGFNSFNTQSAHFQVDGSFTFNSPFAPGQVNIESSSVQIGGGFKIAEGMGSINTDGFTEAGTVQIGGALSWSGPSGASFSAQVGLFTAGQIKISGGGNASGISAFQLFVGSVSIAGTGGTFALSASSQTGFFVNGSIKATNLSAFIINGLGAISGGVSVLNTLDVLINAGLNGAVPSQLSIGGSLSVSQPSSGGFSTAVQLHDIAVGGSLKVLTNGNFGSVFVEEATISGAAAIDLGIGSSLVVEQDSNAMLFAGAVTIKAAGTGQAIVFTTSTTPSALATAPVTIIAPFAAQENITVPAALFSSPVKIKA